MALRIRRNPAPLSGALFISNPRRRKASSKPARKKTMRKRTMRKNGTKKGQVRKTARKAYKRNGTKKGQVRKTARRAYKPLSAAKKKAAAKKRAATIAAKKRKLAAAARKRKATLAAKKRKLAAAAKKRALARKTRRKGTKKGMVRKTARRAYKRKNPARCKNGKVSKSSGKGTCSRNGGVKKKLTAAQYKRTRKSTRLGAKKRVVKKRVVKRKASAKKRRTYRKNPLLKNKQKTRIIRKNPMALQMLAPLERLIAKVPVVGKKVAPYTQPAIVAMVGGAGNALFFNMAASKIPFADKIFGNAFGYTISGVALAVVSAMLPVAPATKKALAISFAAAGGALNAAQIVSEGFSLKAVGEANKLKMLGGSEIIEAEAEAIAGAHMSGAHLGDGMYYDVQPLSGLAMDMGSPSHLNEQMYNGASLGDALGAPADLSALEGKAALHGAHAYAGTFGAPPHKAAGAKSWYSSCVGKEGHRWGWLIQSIGWDNFQKLAKMSHKQRVKAISKMKVAAIRAAKQSFASHGGFDASVAASFQSDMGGLAVQDMSGLAMDMSGLAMNTDMSGVAYDEMDMSGLAIDNLSGLAVVGAGI